MEFLRVLLPILWVIVSTVIGILLYQKGTAVVERLVKRKTSVQRVRFTGSVAIAVAAFCGMSFTTPAFQAGKISVDVSALKNVTALSVRIDDLVLLIQGECSSAILDDRCKQKLADLKDDSNSMRVALGQMEAAEIPKTK